MGKRAPKKGSQKGSRKRSVSSAGRSQQGLPALSSLADLPRFSELTPSDRQRSAFGEAATQAEEEFLEYLSSPEAMSVFETYGFSAYEE